MNENKSVFRSIEVSSSKYECGGLKYITVKSKALKGRGDISLYIPPSATAENTPVVILLHGVYGSHWAWSMNGGAHIALEKLIEAGKVRPMILAMPSDGLFGDGSGYLKHNTADYEKWITEDVMHAVMETTNLASQKSLLFISGLSMGGYGALRIGAKHSHKFRAISAHSSITELSQMELFMEEEMAEFESLICEEEKSVLGIIIKNKGKLPPLRFDCGTEDILINQNRELSKQLTIEKIPHFYKEFPGKHEWLYWETHINDSYLFFEANSQ